MFTGPYICVCISDGSAFKLDEGCVCGYLIVNVDKHTLHDAADFGFDVIFHLHGLVDHHCVAGFDFLTGFYVDGDDASAHRCGDHGAGDRLYGCRRCFLDSCGCGSLR